MAPGMAIGRAGLAAEELRAPLGRLASPLLGELPPVQKAHGQPCYKDDCDYHRAGEELEIDEQDDESRYDRERKKELCPGSQSSRSGSGLSWINIKVKRSHA